MMRKAIAGVLSAVMCASAMLSGVPSGSRNTAQEGEPGPAASQDAQTNPGLTGSNSLARYLAKQGAEQAASQPAAQPLKASAADAVYAVTNLDFDRETGMIRVTSTQSEAAKLLVSFIDEDNPANVYSAAYDVPAGEYVHSTFTADTAQLPAYFTVSARLTGRAGLPLCKAVEIRTYHREMQEITEKDTSDFAPEQVVNLDEDETTNFIVLSEDTVRAETTADSNILISADYDRDIYVFGHIDDSIRSLEQGQYFFIQPTDDDIISTDIQDIVIDGDTATITGTGEIDDMFDFIKVEIETTQTVETNGGADAADAAGEPALRDEAVSDRSYLGANAAVIGNQDDYDKKLEELEALDPALSIPQHKQNLSFIKKCKVKGSDAFTITPSVAADATVKWNLYKSFSYVNLFFVSEVKLTAKLTGTVSKTVPGTKPPSGSGDGQETEGSETEGSETSGTDTDSTETGDSGTESGSTDTGDSGEEPEELPDSVQSDPAAETGDRKDQSPKHLFKIPLTTIGAAEINAFIDIGLTVGFEGKIAFEKSFTKGFVYDSDNGMEKIDFDTSPVIISADLNVTAALDIKVGFEIVFLKGAVTASVAGGIKANATQKVLGGSDGTKDDQTYNKKGINVFRADPATEEERIHSDETCIRIEITLKVYLEVKVSAGFNFADKKDSFQKLKDLLNKAPRCEASIRYETDTILGKLRLPKIVVFCSYNTAGVYSGMKFTFHVVDPDETVECPHQAYRLTFLIGFVNAPAGTDACLKIDNETYPLDAYNPQNKIVLHANPRASSYSYGIYVNGTLKGSGSVRVTTCCQEVSKTIEWPYVEKGTGRPTVSGGVTETGPAFTTVTQTTEPVQTYDYSHLLPPPEMRMTNNTKYDLGEHISGMFFNDGTFTVIGCGDMYPDASIPYSVRLHIRRIVFDDLDPDAGLTINNIADKLFADASDLEVVYMPVNLTAIGDSAFSSCSSLKWLRYGSGDTSETFRLPDTLTTIGNMAFFKCSAAALGDLTVPESVAVIGRSAFGGCTKLTSVTVPDTNITDLRRHVFQDCTGLKEVYFGPGVTCTDTEFCHWLYGCTALEKLTIPTFVLGTTYQNWHLRDLFGSSSVSVPASVKEVTVSGGTVIPAEYFENLQYLEHISCPGNLTEIGSRAFSGCTSLCAASLPDTLTTIGDAAFRSCSAADFGDLVIPESVTMIGKSAFEGCAKITSVIVPDSDGTVLMQHVFRNCAGLKQAYFGLGVNCPDKEYCHWFHDSPALEKLTLPAFDLGEAHNTWRLYYLFSGSESGVSPALRDVAFLTGTVIPDDYFNGLSQIRHIAYPDELTEIGVRACSGCTGLISAEPLSLCGDPTAGGTVDPASGDLIIPESVKLIGKSAFTNCSAFRTVTVPGTTEIMQHAFENCTGLKEAYFGSGVTCPDTEFCHWLHGCNAVEKLVLPAFSFGNRMQVLADIFAGSTSGLPEKLTDVTVTGGTVIPQNYFRNFSTVSSVTFSAALETVEANAFSGCTALTEANLIGEEADWDNVSVNTAGNQALPVLVQKGRFSVLLSGPKDDAAEEDRFAEFSVYAASKDELSYLWQYSTDGGSNWWSMNCTDSRLTFRATKEQNGYLYHCTVIDRNGFRQTTADAKLTVTEKTMLPPARQSRRDPRTLPGYKPGDVNGDNSIDVSDAVLIARFANGDATVPVKDIGVINGDVNGDGNTDIQDVTLILMYIVKRIREFPAAAA
ncbi:MAG: leucine-rich repeat protein [Oscillospiraceae bacterium]|nr:leucine-rich repeat protein [Oscillospiraceae bacterium]